MVLGGGPNRIGQGIEFDYCCVHAAFALRDAGYESIMVNCNPETVSTDYDTSDKLYFEPLTVEDVLSIYEKEKPEGVIVQFGGQTPLNIAAELAEAGVKILGTSRRHHRPGRGPRPLPQDDGRSWASPARVRHGQHPRRGPRRSPSSIGYPLMVRPSFVLGGRGMEVVHDEEMLREYVAAAVDVTPERPILIDQFLENAIECEADALADGTDAFVPAVMEHIELAGIHSGDSACVIPPVSIPPKHIDDDRRATPAGSPCELNVVGPDEHPVRHRRTTRSTSWRPTRGPPAPCRWSPRSATSRWRASPPSSCWARSCPTWASSSARFPHFGVKEAVFPFNMFPEVDPAARARRCAPPARCWAWPTRSAWPSTRPQEAAKPRLPTEGTVLITVDRDEPPSCWRWPASSPRWASRSRPPTARTRSWPSTASRRELIHKLHEGRPNIVDAIMNGEIQLVINTPDRQAGASTTTPTSARPPSATRCPTSPRCRPRSPRPRASPPSARARAAVRSLQDYHRGLG